MLVRKTVNPPYDYNHRKDFFYELVRQHPRLPCVRKAVRNL